MDDFNPYTPPTAELITTGTGLAAEPLAGVGSTLPLALRLYADHIAVIGTLVFVLYGPIELLKGYALYSGVISAVDWRIEMAVNAVLGSLLAPSILFAMVESHRSGRPVRAREALRYGVSRWAETFGARLVAGILVGLGALALILPGLLAAVWYALTDQVIALEPPSPGRALARSKDITAGHRWIVFGSFALAFVALLSLSVLANLPAYVIHHWLFGALVALILDTANLFLVPLGLALYAGSVQGDEGGSDWLQRVRWAPKSPAP